MSPIVDEIAIDNFAMELGDFVFARPPKPYDGRSEFTLFCPLHEEPGVSNKASASWNPIATNSSFTLGVIHCYKAGCKVGPDARKAREAFHKRMGITPKENHNIDTSKWTVVSKATGKPIAGKATSQPMPSDETLREYQSLLLTDIEHLDWLLLNRGLKLDTIREYNWGWHPGKNCYIYPVDNYDGTIHGLRLYDPFHLKANATQKPRDKKRWYATDTKHENQLWGIKQANKADAHVLLFEGETDTMLAHQDGHLNAITQTGGAGTWQTRFGEYFRNKVVYIAYDSDEAGEAGREKVAKELKAFAMAIRFVDLPAGMDYSEYRMSGNTVANFDTLLKNANEVWRRDIPEHMPHEGKKLRDVSGIRDPENGVVPLEVRAYIPGKEDTPYVVPRTSQISCGRNKGKRCEVCPLGDREAGQTMEVTFRPDQDDVLLELLGSDTTKANRFISKSCRLKCNDIEHDDTESWYVEKISMLNPTGSDQALSSDSKFMAYNFYSSENAKINTSMDYRIVGRCIPDPRNRELMFVSWIAEQVDSELDRFVLTPDIKRTLKTFQPPADSLPVLQKTLHRKYHLMSHNVTGIINRHDLHLLYDIVMHSAIAFNFNEQPIDKGWMDAMIIGDTRTGKSRIAKQLNKWYRCGELIAGENTSYAGLVGGSAEMPGSRKRMVEWGTLPRNNGRQLTIDEASGLRDLLSKMSSVRSSGIAEVNKQGGGRVDAKVRLLWIANPVPEGSARFTKAIKEYRGGAVMALINLVGTQEDLARFDIAMMTASDEVPAQAIHAKRKKLVSQYTSECCHYMAMFAWTRKPEHITFANGVEDYITKTSTRISDGYTENPPLVQGANFHEKLARMCVALAVMTYSVKEDGETVVVNRNHVDYICEFVQRCYDNPLFGYGLKSKGEKEEQAVAEENAPAVKSYLTGETRVMGLPPGQEVLKVLKSLPGWFTTRQFDAAIDSGSGQMVMNYLVENGMIKRGSDSVDETAELVRLMRDL